MSEKNNIENIFREAFLEHPETPNPKVLRNIRRKLWKADFLSLDMTKFNMVYSSLIIFAGLGITYLLLSPEAATTSAPSVKQSVAQPTNKVALISADANTGSEHIAKPLPTDKHRLAEALPKDDVELKSRLKAFFTPSEAKGCAPVTIRFQNNSIDAVRYHWDFGNGETTKTENPVVTFTEPGDYKVILTSIDKKKNEQHYQKTISVYPAPKANLEIDIEQSDITTRKLHFKNTSQAGINYAWSFGDSGKSTDENPVHTYTDYGSYHVKLIATNEYGCADSVLFANTFIDKNYQLAFPFTFRPGFYHQTNNGYYKGDNRGSIFYPKNFGAKEYELSIYAPNGIKVFTSTDIHQGWNGYIRGRVAPGGYYTYIARGVYPNDKPFELEGRVKVMVDQLMDNY